MDALQIVRMKDDDLRVTALSGEVGTNVHGWCVAEFNMRSATKMLEATNRLGAAYEDLATTTKQVLDAHHRIKDWTRNLVIATWGLVVVTIVLVVSEFVKKS